MFALFLLAAVIVQATENQVVPEGRLLHRGAFPDYWLERCLVAEDNGLQLCFAGNTHILWPQQKPHPNSTRAGKLVHLRADHGEWRATPAESVPYRVHALAVCKETVVTVGLEPVEGTRNVVVILGRQKGESRILWNRRLRTEDLEPYSASVAALNEGQLLVVVNGPPVGANGAKAVGYVALLVKLASDGSEIWRRQIVADGAVYVSHVGFKAEEIRITGGASGQRFERWSGLNPVMARTWGFEALFSPDSGQAMEIRQVVATESASVRRVLRFANGHATLAGGNFSGTLQNVSPTVINEGKGSTAFIVASQGSGGRIRSVFQPVGEERLAQLVMAKERCYALVLQVESRLPGLGAFPLPSRRLILRCLSPEGTPIGERELASSHFGWFNGGITLLAQANQLVIAFNSETRCQVLGKRYDSGPMTDNFFVLSIPLVPEEAVKKASP